MERKFMEEPTLETVLRCKYNIRETILVEGKFVGLLSNSKNVTSLVSLAIGERCFFVAKVILSGDVLDFELLSMIPLSLLSFAYLDTMKMLKVRCSVKDAQVYQLCSSYNSEEIWDNLKYVIKYLGINKTADIWINAPLNAPSTHQLRVPNTMAYGDRYFGDIVKAELYSDLKPSPNWSIYPQDKSISLPTLIPRCIDAGFAANPVSRRHSSDSIHGFDLQFERFVNDAQTEFGGYNGIMTSCSWNWSTDDLAVSDKLPCTRNADPATPKIIKCKHQQETNGFLSRIKSLFTCSKCKKKAVG